MENDVPIIAAIVAGVIVLILIDLRRFLALPTFDQYRRHPAATDRNGNVRCINCKSRNFYIWFGNSPTGPKQHLCRVCGLVLWRS